MVVDTGIREFPVATTSPLPPFTLIKSNYFYIFWWRIVGAKWSFDVKEHLIHAEVLLPSPTSRQLEEFCGEGTSIQSSEVLLKWDFQIPLNIILIPNTQLCTTISDESFVGLRVPVRTVDEKVTLTIS